MTIAIYTVIPAMHWRNIVTGATASDRGALPWVRQSEEQDWVHEQRGWTVENRVDGTTGVGRQPWKTPEEAQAWVDATHARRAVVAAAHRAYWGV